MLSKHDVNAAWDRVHTLARTRDVCYEKLAREQLLDQAASDLELPRSRRSTTRGCYHLLNDAVAQAVDDARVLERAYEIDLRHGSSDP